MKKDYKKIIVNIFIIILLANNSVSAFTVGSTAVIGENLHFTTEVLSIPYTENFAPGDSENHTMTMKNESEKKVSIYFIDAKETINNLDMNKITFSIYVNGDLYQKGNYSDLKEKLIYVIEQEEITILTNIELNKSAGNIYQEKDFRIEWTLGIMEYEETISLPSTGIQELVETIEIVENKYYSENNITIKRTENGNEGSLSITTKISRYIINKLDKLTGDLNSIILCILLIVLLLLSAETYKILRWIVLILLSLRNTKIYVKVIKDKKEEFKLVNKTRIKKDEEIQINLDKLIKKYETDVIKIIFNKHISKKIDKAKIIVNVKGHILHYDAIYEKKPIELDVNI